MDTRELSLYLIQHITELATSHPSDQMVRELAETYIRLTKQVGCCVSATTMSQYDPHTISALGTLVWLSQKEIKEE